MSMSEIQEAAEIITSAVSPDANIIFGATLKPDLEDELIITVIATGFDSAYFQKQEPDDISDKQRVSSVSDETVGTIDLNLDHSEAATIFADEESKDIWNQPEEDDHESDLPAFLRRRKKNKKDN
jgi:cell division protein FtsZ